ncbi:MAG TPA: DMT family transporter [Stellaceae bacterium]|nr:DMT family transporter [Stellaceae bacterium]
MTAPRLWPAALAAVSGSVIVGFMPLLARQIYAAGVDPPSMLLWRYTIALPALLAAALAMRTDLIGAWRRGAWKLAIVGATLGVGQAITFWESIKTLDTSVAVLLFYIYPALTLVLDRVLFGRPIRARAALCVAIILLGAGLIAVPGLRSGTIDLRGLAWAIPSPLVYVFYLAANSVLLRGQKPLVGAICLYLGMAVAFAAISLGDGLDIPKNAESWGLMAIAALGPGALVITLFSFSVPRLGPSSYAIIANLELVTVVAVGVTLLGEKMTPERISGGTLIVAGIVGYALVKRSRAKPSSLSALGGGEGRGEVGDSRGVKERPPLPPATARPAPSPP